MDRFAGLDTQVLGISIDHVPCLKAWAESLGGIQRLPLLSDFWPHGKVAQQYGVLRPEGYTERALFIIDKTGTICYIDIHDIDDQPDNTVLFDQLCQIDPQAAAREAAHPHMTDAPLPHGGIVMYCTPWCSDCKQARQWLQERNLPYTEVNVIANLNAERQVRRWTGGKILTPTFDIDGEIVIEFDRSRLQAILGE